MKSPALTLFGITLFTHFILIFNNGLYQDDVIVQHFLQHDISSLVEWFVESSYHFGALMHYLLGQLPLPANAHRLLSFLSIWAIGVCIYFIFSRHLNFHRQVSFYIAAFMSVFSSYKVVISIIHTHHIFCIALFYFAWLLYFEFRKSKKFIYGLSSLVTLTVSFSYNSLLVLQYGFCLFDYLRGPKQKPLEYIRKNVFLIILPPLFFIARKKLIIPVGRMAGYNQFASSPKVIFTNFWMHFEQIIGVGNWNAIKVFFSHPLPLTLLGLLIVLFFYRNRQKEENQTDIFSTLKLKDLILYFLIFLFSAATPYALVGKGATLFTWSERQAILMGLPLAFSILIVGKIIKNKAATKLFLAILLLGHSLKTFQEYLYLEAQAAKSDSVIYKLKKIEPLKPGTAIFFFDLNQYQIDHYHWYEINKFTFEAWGKEDWIGIRKYPGLNLKENFRDKIIDGKDIDYKSYRKLFLARDFIPNNCFVNMDITSAPQESLGKFGFNYFLARFFNPKEKEEILDSTVSLNFYGSDCI